MLALTSYDWPGSVRELENAIERAVVFTNGKSVPLSALPQGVSAFAESRHSLTFKIGTPLEELERQAIEITLRHARGDKNMAARLLGIAPRTIYRHLERQQPERVRFHVDHAGFCNSAFQQSVQSVVVARKILIEHAGHQFACRFTK